MKPQEQIWTDFSIGDVLPDPSPLIMDCFDRATTDEAGIGQAFRALGLRYRRRADGARLFEMIRGRAYINLSEYLETVRSGLPLGVTVKGDSPALVLVRGNPLAFAWRIPIFLARFLTTRRKLHHNFRERTYPPLFREAAELRRDDLSVLDDAALWRRFEWLDRRNRGELSRLHLLTDVIAGVTHGVLKTMLRLFFGARAAQNMEMALTTGLDGNFNTETNLALYDVARGTLSIDDFLGRYGHRGNPDWDLASPRWREDSANVRRLASMLTDTDARAKFERQRARRLEAERTLKRSLRGRLLRRELRYYQLYSPLRELSQSACFLWVELSRAVVEEMSRRTGADGLLYFLSFDDLRRYFLEPESRELLLERAQRIRAELEEKRKDWLPHIIVGSGPQQRVGRLATPHAARGVVDVDCGPLENKLNGQTVSPGRVEGRARVVRNLADACGLERGEILVAQFTDPSWTPLFLVAGGLVLEQGSMLSHGAIVAREYGLPAIVNVRDATRRIRDGQSIVLDASAGHVGLKRSKR